ncbi:MAG: extracellular solute-binding protein [Planctomycetota bacterium]
MSRPLWRIFLALSILLSGWWLSRDSPIDRLRKSQGALGIRFSHFGDYQDYALWREIIAEYEQLHPDTHVRQEYVTGLSGHYNTKLRQQILSGTMADVALVQLGPFHELAENFADLSESVTRYENSGDDSERLDGTALAAFVSDGVTRGLPISGGNLLVYCNPTCFEKAERFQGKAVPLPNGEWTLEDFRRLAQDLTCDFDQDGRLDQFGFWHPRWIYYLPFLWSFGAELTDADAHEWRFVGAEAEQAVEFYRDLVNADHVCPRPAEVPQLFQDVGFLTGRVAQTS